MADGRAEQRARAILDEQFATGLGPNANEVVLARDVLALQADRDKDIETAEDSGRDAATWVVIQWARKRVPGIDLDDGSDLDEVMDRLDERAAADERVAATLRQERDGAEKAAREEAGEFHRQLDELREENARLRVELTRCGDDARMVIRDALLLKDEAERVAATLRQALEPLANEAARAVTEPRRFHENEDERQQALGTAVARARAALAAAGDTETA